MTSVRINGAAQQPVPEVLPHRLTPERLRTIVESAHLNFLIGAGTSSPYFAALGNIEDALTEVADSQASEPAKALALQSRHTFSNRFSLQIRRLSNVLNRRKASSGRTRASFVR